MPPQPRWAVPSNCEPKQTFPKLLLDSILSQPHKKQLTQWVISPHAKWEQGHTLPLTQAHEREGVQERGEQTSSHSGSSSSHAPRRGFLLLPHFMLPPLHASVFNGCCQKGYQANVFSVFGNGSYELRLLPDSILVWAWLENVCCGHLSRIDWVEHRYWPRLRQGGNHISWKKNGSKPNMGADTHKLNC